MAKKVIKKMAPEVARKRNWTKARVMSLNSIFSNSSEIFSDKEQATKQKIADLLQKLLDEWDINSDKLSGLTKYRCVCCRSASTKHRIYYVSVKSLIIYQVSWIDKVQAQYDEVKYKNRNSPYYLKKNLSLLPYFNKQSIRNGVLRRSPKFDFAFVNLCKTCEKDIIRMRPFTSATLAIPIYYEELPTKSEIFRLLSV